MAAKQGTTTSKRMERFVRILHKKLANTRANTLKLESTKNTTNYEVDYPPKRPLRLLLSAAPFDTQQPQCNEHLERNPET
jgi:hypothetical protein